MALEDAETIVEKIVKGSGKRRDAVQKLIDDKKAKFSGLLTDAGAAFMIAKELGIRMNVEEQLGETIKISQLEDGMTNADVLARVMQIFTPKKFEKKGKKGTLCNMIVADDSGETRLTLWRNDAKKIEDDKIERGSILLLKNCYVTSYKDRKQLNLSFNGSVEVKNEHDAKEKLPAAQNKTTKLGELEENSNDVNVVGRISRIFNVREFAKEGGSGKLLNFELADGERAVRCTAWNDLTESLGALQQNDIVKIEGAYTKKGLKGYVELQLGWRARIIKEPKGIEIPALASQAEQLTEKKISELNEGDRFVKLGAKIAELQQGRLHYNVCPKCNGKVQRLDFGWICGKCGEVATPSIEEVIGLKIEDGSGSISAVFYGKEAERIMEISKEELKAKIQEGKIEGLFDELKAKLAGKKLTASGLVRKNKFSGQLEFVVKQFAAV